MGSGTISRELTSERTQDLGKVTLEADERLNKLNFQWQSLRFGMAKEIAAHAPFRKEFISAQKVETGLTIQHNA